MAVTPPRPSAGEARTLVVVEEQRREPDGQGGYEETTYSEVDRGYAAVEPLSTFTRSAMGRDAPALTHRVRFREDVEVPSNGRLRVPGTGEELFVDTVLERPNDPPVVEVTSSPDHS